ncbi:hypothetical protein [Parachlamydia acanthamoebae]|uniref:Uncharacterized protein n=1 Tax=Parachlamydia acanthamoebae TaxID=83552 RepID=A0A0C1EHD0_9BACT|nr:hypothetical protein [Parachlamydia acanthamoebae]KIA76044.1 hypothetical protein DB43_CF00010 [Parachlamydia acanthamoebae]
MSTRIASTVQQLSMSFGVALAAVLIGLFLPTGHTADARPPVLFGAFNKTFLILGLLTLTSTLIFRRLRSEDGSNMRSQ